MCWSNEWVERGWPLIYYFLVNTNGLLYDILINTIELVNPLLFRSVFLEVYCRRIRYGPIAPSSRPQRKLKRGLVWRINESRIFLTQYILFLRLPLLGFHWRLRLGFRIFCLFVLWGSGRVDFCRPTFLGSSSRRLNVY